MHTRGFKSLSAIGVATALSAVSPSHAAIDVWAQTNATVTVTNVGLNRFDVTITQQSAGSCLVAISSTDTDDVIQRITLINNVGIPDGAESCILTIRKNDPQVFRSSLAGVEEIDLDPGTRMRLAHLVIDGSIGDPTDPTDAIEATSIEQVEAGGNLFGAIIASGNYDGTATDMTVDIDGNIESGKVISNARDIAFLNVDGAVFDSSSGIIPEIWSAGSIDQIDTGDDFRGYIGRNFEGFSGNSDVGTVNIGARFRLTPQPSIMNSLGSMTVGEDFRGEIEVLSALATGSTIRIQDDFTATASIELTTNGLAGQIIVNASNNASSWLGDVVVGSTTLAPGYSDTAATLGGGAAGVVPFDLHGSDSLPIDGSGVGYVGAANAAPSPANPIFVRHYGPVRFDELAGSPVVIEGKIGGDMGFTVFTDCFTVEEAGTGDETRLKITPDFQLPNASEWRITPVFS